MPRPRGVLNTLVRDVFARQTEGVLPARGVFHLLEQEFTERDCMLNMVLRTLRQVYTLHFMQQPLAAALACPPADAESLIEEELCPFQLELPDDLVEHLRTGTASVQDDLEEGGEPAIEEWGAELRRWRHRRRTVETLFWDLLLRTDAYQAGIEHQVGPRAAHRILMYKALLPGAADDVAEAARQPIVRVVLEEVARAQRHQLLGYLKVAMTALETHSVPDDPAVVPARAKLAEVEKQLRDSTAAAGGAARGSGSRSGGGAGATPARKQLEDARRGAGAALMELLALACGGDVRMREGVVCARKGDVARRTGGLGGAAEPRHTVLGALSDPARNLGSLQPTQVPDPAVAYQVLAEGARLVNLYDWYNTFAALRGAHAQAGDEAGQEVQLQARFARAVAVLEHLGLLKHTKRKTDHVQRLVFE